MKIKFVAIIAVVALAFAGAAQAAGVLSTNGEGDPAEAKEHTLTQKLSQRAVSAPTGALARTRRGARGPRGPKGPVGPQGAPGPQGTFGAITTVKGASTFLCGWESGACSVGAAVAQCPAGTAVISGGYAGAGVRAFIDSSVSGGWYVGAANESAFSTSFYAIALCAS